MPKFFVEREYITKNTAKIIGEDVKHIGTVLRAKIGDNITVCDGNGFDYECEITNISKSEIELKILNKTKCQTEPSVFITLYQGLPKGEKCDYIIQKGIELGVSKILFFNAKRSVSKPDEKALKSKLQRWQAISLSAAKQSGRGIIPKIDFLADTKTALSEMNKDSFKVLFYEGNGTTPFKQILEATNEINSFSFMIGPEGGFDDSEILSAKEKGIPLGGLGSRILRTETASGCVLSAFMFFSNNL
jgi:16S rRNA (uracil1498-N3)-methyltransferase